MFLVLLFTRPSGRYRFFFVIAGVLLSVFLCGSMVLIQVRNLRLSMVRCIFGMANAHA